MKYLLIILLFVSCGEKKIAIYPIVEIKENDAEYHTFKTASIVSSVSIDSIKWSCKNHKAVKGIIFKEIKK